MPPTGRRAAGALVFPEDHREGKHLQNTVFARQIILKVNRPLSRFERLAGLQFPTPLRQPFSQTELLAIGKARSSRRQIPGGTLNGLAFQKRDDEEGIQAVCKDRPRQRQQILRDRVISLNFPSPLSQPNSLSVFCSCTSRRSEPLPTSSLSTTRLYPYPLSLRVTLCLIHVPSFSACLALCNSLPVLHSVISILAGCSQSTLSATDSILTASTLCASVATFLHLFDRFDPELIHALRERGYIFTSVAPSQSASLPTSLPLCLCVSVRTPSSLLPFFPSSLATRHSPLATP